MAEVSIIVKAKDAASAVIKGVGGALSGLKARLSGVAQFAGKLGGILKGVLVGGLLALGGAIMGLKAGFGAIKDAMENTGDAAGAGGAAVKEAGKDLADGAEEIDAAAETTTAAAEKARVAFGAFGKVGEGFIQAQGAVTTAAAKNAEAATGAADKAGDALEEVKEGAGAAGIALSRFGDAVDRIGAAWDKAKTKILQAIGKALTPALEALADLMESPEFQAFVDLLAKDLAKAVEAVAAWFVDEAIPAISDFMDEVNAAGGPVEYLKGKFKDFKDKVLTFLKPVTDFITVIKLSINELRTVTIPAIVAKLEEWAGKVGTFFEGIGTKLSEVWTTIETKAVEIAETVRTAVETVFVGLGNVIITKLNKVVDNINTFIDVVNTLAEAVGLPSLPKLKKIPALAEGGIVTRPTLALLGEGGNSEAVVPLDGRAGIGNTYNVYVTVPAGTPNARQFGETVGESIVSQMRRAGLRLPAGG
jgi:methyl-accepting chemotaxis protein